MTFRDRTPPSISINLWFVIPFLLWVVVGGIMLAQYSSRELFETVNAHHSSGLDVLMRNLTNFGDGTAISLILLILLAAPKFRNWWYVITAVVCNALPAIFIQIAKGIFNAPRPFEYFKSDPSWIHFNQQWGERLYHHSFPSGHSGGAFSMYCFLALLLPRKYRWVGVLLFCFALVVGYSRLYLAAHFFADVYAGSIIGTLTTIMGFAFMKRYVRRFYGDSYRDMSVIDN
jgi:membrane-associated phospholipid phosphatase